MINKIPCMYERRGLWISVAALMAGILFYGCAAGMGKTVYTTKGLMIGSKSGAIMVAAERGLSDAGSIVGTNKENGEIYANVRGFAVQVTIKPGSSWAVVTCRADGSWSQGAANDKLTITSHETALTVEGYTPEDCAKELFEKIQDRL